MLASRTHQQGVTAFMQPVKRDEACLTFSDYSPHKIIDQIMDILNQ